MRDWIRWTFFRDRYLWVWLAYGFGHYRRPVRFDGDGRPYVRHWSSCYYLTGPGAYPWMPINFKKAQLSESFLREVA